MLQVRGDREGVPVAVVIQAVEQAHAFGRHEALTVQESGGRLKGRRLAPAQYFVEDEPEQAVVRPLAPFEQQNLAGRKENYPAGRIALAEDSARDDVAPGLFENGFGRRGLAVVLHPVWTEGERVFVVSVRIVGAKDEKLRCAVPNSRGMEHRVLRRPSLRPTDDSPARSRNRGWSGTCGTSRVAGERGPCPDAHAGIAAGTAGRDGPARATPGQASAYRWRPRWRLPASGPSSPGCRWRRARPGNGGCRTRSRSGCRRTWWTWRAVGYRSTIRPACRVALRPFTMPERVLILLTPRRIRASCQARVGPSAFSISRKPPLRKVPASC